MDAFEMLEKFFTPQRYYCGGSIPKHLLFDKKNKALLKIPLPEAISITHAALGRVRKLARSKYSKKVGQLLIPKIIHACESYNIPKHMIGGMMLMYIELVEACSWRHLVNEDYQLKCVKVG